MIRDNVIGTERFADHAWERFAEEQQRFAVLYQTPDVDRTALREQLVRGMAAEKRWKAAYAAVGATRKRSPEADRAWLACEGVLLLSLIGGFINIFLTDLLDHFWPVAICLAIAAGLGAWFTSFAGRVSIHLGRRM